MPIAFRAAEVAANGAATTSIGVAKPAGTADGDLLLAFVVISADQTITDDPEGWTLLAGQATGTATGDCRHHVYWKVAAGEPSSWTWAFSSGADSAAAVLAYSGASSIQASGYNLMTGSTDDHTVPSVTPTTASTWAVYAVGVNPVYDGNTTFTTPSGLSSRAEADPGAGTTNRAVLKVWDQALPSAAATGAKTTELNNSAKGVGYSLILAPSGAAEQVIVLDSRAVA
ncbi:MAG TPA: hypothetical protein VEG38_08870 [Acidimicrobiia bacterium]|nr:hypothetical protein [Acidimicrobiia bacterium]